MLEYEIAGYDSRPVTVGGASYSELTVAGAGRTGEAGKPSLPVRGAMIGIPFGAQVSLQILEDDSRRRRSRVRHCPSRPFGFGTICVIRCVRTQAVNINRRLPPTPRTNPSRQPRHELRPLVRFGVNDIPSSSFSPFSTWARPDNSSSIGGFACRSVSATHGGARAEAQGELNEGPFEPTFKQMFVNYDSAKSWRARTTLGARAQARSTASAGGPWYKIAKDAEGIYRVTCANLQSAGVNLTTLAPQTLQLFKNGTELAIQIVGSNWYVCDPNIKYLEFYAQKTNTKYTRTNIYWLTHGRRPGKGYRHAMGAARPDPDDSSNLYRYASQEKRSWFGDQLLPWSSRPFRARTILSTGTGTMSGRNTGVPSQDYDFALEVNHIAPGNHTAVLVADMVGVNTGSHHTRLSVTLERAGHWWMTRPGTAGRNARRRWHFRNRTCMRGRTSFASKSPTRAIPRLTPFS